MPRCPDCNRFASLDEQEPEEQGVEVDGDGHVTAEVRIVNSCAKCSTQLTEATLTLEGDVSDEEMESHREHDLRAEADNWERVQDFKGSGRYTQTFYGASCEVAVYCNTCGLTEPIAELTLEGYEQAKNMESMV